ncbi:Reverse transcriptase zinc-binding domain [Macleaya cordata]|uniref:Reverse transcriptase zinc-binding domain n=1 Tax=Macleaya cordata TaxID=56857 RepID=A0A200PRR2_MACCD|nr:Reverse transcriptase zinc-binding domain [Macleaya cordata]
MAKVLSRTDGTTIYLVSLPNISSHALSHAGRLTLILSVLASMHVFYMCVYKLPKCVCDDLVRLQRNFWWNHSDQKHHLVFTAWSKLCQPKSSAGLGIRDPMLINISLLLKLAWRFLTQRDSFWAELLTAKYLRSDSFWTRKVVYGSSPIWAGIMSVRDSISKFVCWSIGDGHTVRVWTDPWVPGVPTFRVDGYPYARERIFRVVDLFISQTRCWNAELIHSCFPPHEAKAILSIRLARDACADKLIWTPTTSGVFSTKSAYKCLTQEVASTSFASCSHKFDWHSLWKVKGLAPRIQLFIWRIFTDSIGLKHNIIRHGIEVDPICVVCGLENETTDHLFLHCEIAKKTWFGSPIGYRVVDNSTPLSDLLLSWLSSKNSIEVFKLGCNIVWSLWKARNRWVFDKTKVQVFNVIQATVSSYNFYNIPFDPGGDVLINDSSTAFSSNTSAGWKAPDVGFVKINVDGALKANAIAAGVILRDHMGDVLACQTIFDGNWAGKDGAIEAEARAFLKGIELARIHVSQGKYESLET